MKAGMILLSFFFLIFCPAVAGENKTSYIATMDISLVPKKGALESLVKMLYALFSTVPEAMVNNGLIKDFNDFVCDEASVQIDVENGKVWIKLIGRNTKSKSPFKELLKDRADVIKQLVDELEKLGENAEKDGIETYYIKGFVVLKGTKTFFNYEEIRSSPAPEPTAPSKVDPHKKHESNPPSKALPPNNRPDHAARPRGRAISFYDIIR